MHQNFVQNHNNFVLGARVTQNPPTNKHGLCATLTKDHIIIIIDHHVTLATTTTTTRMGSQPVSQTQLVTTARSLTRGKRPKSSYCSHSLTIIPQPTNQHIHQPQPPHWLLVSTLFIITLIPRKHTLDTRAYFEVNSIGSLTWRQLKEHVGAVHHVWRARLLLLLRGQHAWTSSTCSGSCAPNCTSDCGLSRGHCAHQLIRLWPHLLLLWLGLLLLLLLLTRLSVLHVGSQVVPGPVVRTCRRAFVEYVNFGYLGETTKLMN